MACTIGQDRRVCAESHTMVTVHVMGSTRRAVNGHISPLRAHCMAAAQAWLRRRGSGTPGRSPTGRRWRLLGTVWACPARSCATAPSHGFSLPSSRILAGQVAKTEHACSPKLAGIEGRGPGPNCMNAGKRPACERLQHIHAGMHPWAPKLELARQSSSKPAQTRGAEMERCTIYRRCDRTLTPAIDGRSLGAIDFSNRPGFIVAPAQSAGCSSITPMVTLSPGRGLVRSPVQCFDHGASASCPSKIRITLYVPGIVPHGRPHLDMPSRAKHTLGCTCMRQTAAIETRCGPAPRPHPICRRARGTMQARSCMAGSPQGGTAAASRARGWIGAAVRSPPCTAHRAG